MQGPAVGGRLVRDIGAGTSTGDIDEHPTDYEKCLPNCVGAGETKSRSRQKCTRRKSDKHLPRIYTTDTSKLQNIFGCRRRLTAVVKDGIRRTHYKSKI